MGEIGKLLKKSREDQKLSLRDVEAQIKIRAKYLEALENEQYHVLPGKVYLFGFLKSYAKFLGLDGDIFVSELKQVLKEDDRQPETVQHQQLFHKFRGLSDRVKNRSLLKITLILLTIILGIMSYGYYDQLPRKVTTEELIDRKSPLLNNKEQTMSSDYLLKGNPPQSPEMIGTPANQLDNGTETIEVIIQVKDEPGARCWVEVQTDTNRSFSGTLERNERKVFNAKDKIKILLGNAGAVIVIYNGEDQGSLGKIGQVSQLEFPSEP